MKLPLPFFAVCCVAVHKLSAQCNTEHADANICHNLGKCKTSHNLKRTNRFIERLTDTHHFGNLPAFTTERFHREPPQVKMTARINSRPHSLTPYVGSSIGWTPETSRHTANTTAFNIMLSGWGDLNKRMLPALCKATLYVSLFCNAMPACDLGHLLYKGGLQTEARGLCMQAFFRVKNRLLTAIGLKDLYRDKRWTKGCIIIQGVRDHNALLIIIRVNLSLLVRFCAMFSSNLPATWRVNRWMSNDYSGSEMILVKTSRQQERGTKTKYSGETTTNASFSTLKNTSNTTTCKLYWKRLLKSKQLAWRSDIKANHLKTYIDNISHNTIGGYL